MISPTNVVVGKYYNVPSGIYNQNQIIPLIFPSHKDGFEICVQPTEEHYHVDKRFIHKDNYRDNFSLIPTKKVEKIKYRKLKCYKTTSCLTNKRDIFSIEKLNRIYHNNKLINNRCPHHGVQILNSCGTCPAHNLIWNLQTERLKYKLPFYVKIKETNDCCKIENSSFNIKLSKYVDQDYLTLILIDSDEKQYGNFHWPLIHYLDTTTHQQKVLLGYNAIYEYIFSNDKFYSYKVNNFKLNKEVFVIKFLQDKYLDTFYPKGLTVTYTSNECHEV